MEQVLSHGKNHPIHLYFYQKTTLTEGNFVYYIIQKIISKV